SSFLTSKWNQECGFCQSTRLRTPSTITFLVTSNCAWTAWCALVAVPKPRARTASEAAVKVLRMYFLQSRKWLSSIFVNSTSLAFGQKLRIRKDHIGIGPSFAEGEVEHLYAIDLVAQPRWPVRAGVKLVEYILAVGYVEARVRFLTGPVVNKSRHDLLGATP